MGKVHKVGANWEYIQSYSEIIQKNPIQSEQFNQIAYLPITDRAKMQICIIRKNKKYGIYTADHTYGFGGPGTWCSPTEDPFPYDEVKYCVFPFNYPDEEYGVFAFRIADRWGIIKVVDGDADTGENFDVIYPLTKRRIAVKCEYSTLKEAETQLNMTYEWKNPFAKDDEWNKKQMH